MEYKAISNSNVAKNIYKIRKREGLSQEEFAEKLGLSRQTVSKWEMGQSSPRAERIELICKEFNISPEEVYGEENKNDYKTKEGNQKDKVEERISKDNIKIGELNNNKYLYINSVKKKRRTIIKVILGMLIIVYIANFLFKFVVFTHFINKLKIYENIENYYCKITKFGEEGLEEEKKIWYNKGFYKIMETARLGNNYTNSVEYLDTRNNNRFFFENDILIKEKNEKDNNFSDGKLMYYYMPEMLKSNIRNLFVNCYLLDYVSIYKTEKILGIRFKNYHIQLDKETYLPILYEIRYEPNKENKFDLMTYYKIEIGNVTDEDLDLDKIKDASKEAPFET